MLRALLMLVAAFVLVAAVFQREAASTSGNPHAFGPGDCRGCHITDPARAVISGGKLRMTAPVLQLCARCHRGISDNYSHPVEIIPTAAIVPPDMPLSWNGKLTCATCHDIHASPTDSSGGKSNFLRRALSGRAFCDVCHRSDPLASRGGSHKTDIEIAHMGRYIVESPGIGIDAVSSECLSCHDGSRAGHVDANLGAGTWRHSGDGRESPHPIGVNYDMAQARRRDMTPRTMLPKALRLVNGMVGCGTCHDPYSRMPYKLSMERSELCTTCHNK